MSDKSFGDHINRNVVKNSLLSSAVIGLSLEDLTHKAVLLPATPSQGQVTVLDQQQGSQTSTLAHSDHDKPSFPSGDAFSTISLSTTPSCSLPNKLDRDGTEKSSTTRGSTTHVQSKAFVKSEDDFDVNEYIARLQGTRYVSAPLHSHLKEDQNANLDAEEALEEINLNESKPEPIQQSLTADIAQNFSQLPAVLPHVASAVFSSFSNMLSMKSREQTPEQTGYQQTSEFENPDAGVPLMGVEENTPKDFGLPPKEPSVTGVSSYRISSKKKYAQIPGLSSNAVQSVYQNPNPPITANQNTPFIPEGAYTDSSIDTIKQNTPLFTPGDTKDEAFKTVDVFGGADSVDKAQNVVNFNEDSARDNAVNMDYGVQIPGNAMNIIGPVQVPGNQSNVAQNQFQINQSVAQESKFAPIDYKDITTPRIPIIPPPPMFSNQRTGQATGKSVLPPSVARRISANQPLIKQPMPTTVFSENIFVPMLPNPLQTESLPSAPEAMKPSIQPHLNIPAAPKSQTSSVPIFTPEVPLPGLPALPESSFLTPKTESVVSSTVGPFFTPTESSKPPSASFAPNKEVPQGFGSNIPPASFQPSLPPFGSIPPPIGASLPPNASSIPQSHTTPFVPTFAPPSQVAPSFFNPQPHQDPITQVPPGITPEPKPLVEPPKAAGLNFRMTKKRPQYYSGPIEGVGAISNNVKPVIAPVIPPVPSDSTAYQGSFFAPEQQPQNELPGLIEQAAVPFDINKPVQPGQFAFEAKPAFDNPQQYQNYNTAFDLSRTTTEAYEPPKQETKGFGIIGSLKSKLSSIDINKIQSSVTTFFDPAYNDAKGEPALETAPHAQGQYGEYSQEQSNFEVMVPSVEPNPFPQFGYPQGYNFDQSYQSYLAQNAYNYQYEAHTSNIFTEPNYTQQVCNTNTEEYSAPTNYTQENIPQNVANLSHNVEDRKETAEVSFYNPAAEHSQVKFDSAVSRPSTFDKPKTIPNVNVCTSYINPNAGSHGAIGDVAKASTIPPIEKDLSLKQVVDIIPKAESFFDYPIDKGERKDVTQDKALNAPTGTTQGIIPFSAPLPPAMSFFDSPSTSAHEPKAKSIDLVKEMEKLAMAEEIAIANSPFQAIDLQIGSNAEFQAKETSAVVKSVDQDITAIVFDKNVQNVHINKEVSVGNDQKGISLMESLTKDTTPVVAVSSVPLFGLSALIDKNKTTPIENDPNICLYEATKEIKPILEEQSSFSFFENIRAENKADEELTDIKGLSISDVKNVLLFEPPQKDLGALHYRTNSLSLLKDLPEAEVKNTQNLSEDKDLSWNLDTAMVTSKDNVNLLFDRKASGFFDHLLPENSVEEVLKDTDATEQASNFNICETCREVTSPEIKETDNVTSQLIENMNASIQLSNPVETILAESLPTASDRSFEEKQFDDINRITEDTIETLQGQSAAADNVSTSSNYGWNTEQLAYASIAAIDKEFVTDTSVDPNYDSALDPGYTFKIDPNTIGFFNDNSLFFDNVPKNASDEIKAELKTQEDIVPPRQMGLPSAPPAEDDTKSDETGYLDVLSIEQDAKKDFPLEEEFIIEPSETDDDKIEFRERKKSSEDSSHDTFTDRIEKFKNKAGVEYSSNDDIYQKPAGIVPPKSMASYFDTGNYAVETHYRKSLTSPTHINIFQDQLPSNKAMQEQVENVLKENIPADSYEEGMGHVSEDAFRLPPGFEDELRLQYLGQFGSDENKAPYIPETSTQTRPTVTTTFNIANTQEFYTIAGLKDNKPIAQTVETIVAPTIKPWSKDNIPKPNEMEKVEPVVKYNYEAPTLEKAFGSTNTLIKDHTQALGVQINPNVALEPTAQCLPDPINFFSQPEAPVTEAPESFSRLASYFSMPTAQPEHSKSFFELSQSQNHYRHVPKQQEASLGQGHDSKTRENLQNLMQDLTSTQNINMADKVVRTINYFSVEYENVGTSFPKLETNDKGDDKNVEEKNENLNTNVKNLGHNLDSKKLNDFEKVGSLINSNVNTDEIENTVNDDITEINNCKYCCNTKLIDIKDFKVRTAPNSDSREKRDGNMGEKESNNQKKTVTVDFGHLSMEEEAQDEVTVVSENRSSSEYTPVRHHWFYRVDIDEKSVWRGFSTTDSNTLEQNYLSPDLTEDTVVPTDGGRFDVNILGRLRIAVYWKEKPTNVRRCSWFYKGTTDARYVPYTEAVADKLEEEYRHGVTTGEWHRRLVLPHSELVVMHGPAVMVHFLHAGPDSFSSPPFLLGKKVYRNPPKIRVARDLRPDIDHLILLVHGAGEYKRGEYCEAQSTSRPRVVRRGYEESEIEDPEPSSIDHLLLLCHGVGSACDMRFRSVEEVVEDFRSTSLQLLQSHYRNSYDNGIVSRVEVLPISWHAQLHVGEGGVDKRLNKVTLESIPRLRAFTNHTVLDALFYTSPAYHQIIIDTVCSELNRIYGLFKQRNPSFKGGVSLGGHSLGSVILYDLLCHQTPEKPLQPKTSAHKTYLPGTSQPLAMYPQLQFLPAALYALGSPIAIFECIRGVEALGMDFALPTCKNFFNIFHPYDPIAYRIEPLINPLLQDAKPFLIPHHKGRKRMHLELKDTMVRVGSDLKQKLVESLRTTWNKWKATPPPEGQLEKVVEEEMEKEQLCNEAKEEQINAELTRAEMLGALNGGRRVDYVLQEAPLEMINEYLFAMSSHVGYWESEDTMLLMLREIYSSLGVQPDCTVPQQSMTVTRNVTLDETVIVADKACPSTSRQ